MRNYFRTILFVLLGVFGLMAGWAPAPAFAAASKVDVNHATEEELEELPGVGPTYAKKIINGRPYKTVDDLINAGVPQRTVDKIKDSIKFGKVKAPKAATQAKTKAAPTQEPVQGTAKAPPRKGMVWVNTSSNVYHKEGDRWYGKTKQGKYMTEDEAIKAGAHLSKQDKAD